MFSGLLTGNLSDAAEALGLPRAVIVGSSMVGLGNRTVYGRAFTMRQRYKRPGIGREENMVKQFEVSSRLASPGDFIVIETGGIVDVATWGENHSRRCHSRGIVGMLTDGATRDAGEIDELAFPVFCRGFSPVKSRWNLETVSIGEAVTINSVTIRPGDYVVADRSGIVVVPAERADAVLASAHNIRKAELAAQTSGDALA